VAATAGLILPDGTERELSAEFSIGRAEENDLTIEKPTVSRHHAVLTEALCSGWLAGGSLDDLPTNEEIAARLGTPGATETVKAALRRAYAKAGLTEGSPYAKRRALCKIARQRGWV
jgi:hypothetical protein